MINMYIYLNSFKSLNKFNYFKIIFTKLYINKIMIKLFFEISHKKTEQVNFQIKILNKSGILYHFQP